MVGSLCLKHQMKALRREPLRSVIPGQVVQEFVVFLFHNIPEREY